MGELALRPKIQRLHNRHAGTRLRCQPRHTRLRQCHGDIRPAEAQDHAQNIARRAGADELYRGEGRRSLPGAAVTWALELLQRPDPARCTRVPLKLARAAAAAGGRAAGTRQFIWSESCSAASGPAPPP